jgi:hypothetical protein
MASSAGRNRRNCPPWHKISMRSEVDSNDDGVISEREAEQTPVSLKEAFDVVDADSDSNVSTAEYEAARVNLLEGIDFAALDTDDDGVIGIKEAEELPWWLRLMIAWYRYGRFDKPSRIYCGTAQVVIQRTRYPEAGSSPIN